MIILAPEAKESAYMKAAEVFKDYYKKVTGELLEITNEISGNEDMVVIGSEAVQPFVYELFARRTWYKNLTVTNIASLKRR